jgi:alpha-beta hydrolase superfamily lysophospholipase
LEFQDNPLPNNKFCGVFFQAPLVQNSVMPPPIVVWLLRNCCLHCCPLSRTPDGGDIKIDMITRDPGHLKEIEEDKFRTGLPARIKTGDNVLRLMEEEMERIPDIEYPFLTIHGDNDLIVPISCSKLIYEKSSTPAEDKKFIVIPGGYHDAFVELEKTPDYEEIYKFFEKYISKN